MRTRKVELEAEVVDWLDQLPMASFATAAFFIGVLSLQGALLPRPYTVQLGGKISRLHQLRFFVGLEPAGVTYSFRPEHRLVLLTVFRDSHVQRRYEVERAREALSRCAGHEAADHVPWHEARDPRMTAPSAAEMYEVARLAYEFGRAVRAAREQRRWTTRHLAEAAGASESAIARCEVGGIPPTAPVAARILRALGPRNAGSEPRVRAFRAGEMA